ncbi:hypothetical protein FPSE_08831 [Fusarium pseudograminearum CS3096]|uniref:Hydrophobin n=1 Tax=Fusarium pseudograminearum (strain CS3096) TaxID=1028729 RepID=K3VAY8_FUSPC|nr:hypothetical protein FPSE_08831 [Fusarium pseudograminearum CS3096]EKJ70972.1 hypothetical protein FPSE_08831 [Fusarium pseudograminearum CS3096]
MKFTTLATTILSIALGADIASAACCDLKVCDGFNLKGRCKTACYPYTNTPVAINGDGLKGPIASGKTDTDCHSDPACSSTPTRRAPMLLTIALLALHLLNVNVDKL